MGDSSSDPAIISPAISVTWMYAASGIVAASSAALVGLLIA